MDEYGTSCTEEEDLPEAIPVHAHLECRNFDFLGKSVVKAPMKCGGFGVAFDALKVCES